MKTRILFLLFFISNYSFSQTVNDYKAVVIPMKYEFQKEENQYRLQTITKMNLKKAGFEAFYANESSLVEYQRCSLLYIDVKKENAFLISKLYVVFKDCFGTIIYQSEIGKSREKEFQTAYVDALNNAFVSVYDLNYKYNGNTNFSPKSETTTQYAPDVPVSSPTNSVIGSVAVPAAAVSVAKKESTETITAESKSSGLLYAQPTSYGYQLIDSEPKVVMKVYKTSNSDSYMAKKGEIQGALVSKNNQWFFEYYQNDKLISEKIDVKF